MPRASHTRILPTTSTLSETCALKQFKRQDNNAQVTGYITNSLQAVQTMVDETLYLKYRLPDYMPMNTSIPDGAASYLVRILDRTGRGQFITNFGTDAPVAQRVASAVESQQPLLRRHRCHVVH